MGVQVDEEILAKSGPELFKELLRVYSVAEVDDYFKAGQWKDEVMRTDVQLLYQHSREAGADDPTPLENVTVPELPKATVGGMLAPGGMGAVRPAGAAFVPAVRPAGPAGVAAVAPMGSPVAELRLIALFVAKWTLDPARTKMMLAKLTPQRRRYVLANFTSTFATPVDATNSLQTFLTKCEQTNAWGAASPMVAVPKGVAPRPVAFRPAGVAPLWPAAPVAAGVKRPLTPAMSAMATQANKRQAVAPGRMAVTPGKPALRPTTPQGIRPAMVTPKAGGGGLIRGLLQRY